MSATSAAVDAGGRQRKGLAGLQRIGRSLMLPIAALPAAALLLRLGQPDLLGEIGALEDAATVIGAAGGALFENLPLLFAVGVAIGFARKADGSTAFAAVVGYVVLTAVFKAMSPFVLGEPAEGEEQELIKYGVLAGILIGIIAALLWERFYRIKLPPYLAFFGGRRFVPIITAGVALVLGVLLAFLYPAFDAVITNLGETVTESAVLGGGVFGVVNRLLIPLGLHHIINSVVWFVVGEYKGATGDLNRFFEGDPNAGIFMTGFFPIMMFALPAAAIAIWHEAKPENKKVVGGIMISAAFTSFLTGITEPIEFAFLFVAWPLFLIHAVLTGTSLALVNALDIHHGFGFSAGAIDYVLNYGIAQKPLLLIPIGLVYAAIYYFLFRWVIRKWNLRTPGREDEATEETEGTIAGDTRPELTDRTEAAVARTQTDATASDTATAGGGAGAGTTTATLEPPTGTTGTTTGTGDTTDTAGGNQPPRT